MIQSQENYLFNNYRFYLRLTGRELLSTLNLDKTLSILLYSWHEKEFFLKQQCLTERLRLVCQYIYGLVYVFMKFLHQTCHTNIYYESCFSFPNEYLW